MEAANVNDAKQRLKKDGLYAKQITAAEDAAAAQDRQLFP